MTNMKKLLALLLVLTMLFSISTLFAGCDGNSGKKAASSNDSDGDENQDSEGTEGDGTVKGQTTAPTEAEEPTAPEEEPQGLLKDESAASELVGTWTCEHDLLEDMLEDSAGLLGEDVDFGELQLYTTLEFLQDGQYRYIREIDPEESAEFMSWVLDQFMELVYALSEMEGKSREDVDKEFMDEMSMTIEEYFQQEIQASINESAEELTHEKNGFYCVDRESGRILLADSVEGLEDTDEYIVYSLDGDMLTMEDAFLDGKDLGESAMALPWVLKRQ